MAKLRKQEAGRQALAELKAIRAQIAAQSPGIDAEEAYREAGFSKEAIASTLEKDKALAEANGRNRTDVPQFGN